MLTATSLKGALMGGHGTTVDTLCYLFMLLSEHPRHLADMRKEHDSIFSPCLSTTKQMLLAAPSKLQDLPYTEAVLRETLRLFPVGMPLREATPGETIRYKGLDLPLGDRRLVVVLNAQDIHYNPDLYPKPSKFKPERWLDSENEIPRAHFRTFSRGSRMCLGMNLAMNQMKVVLLMVARDFDFRCADLKPNPKARAEFTKLDVDFGDVIFQEIGLEAKPRGPMRMLVKKRTGREGQAA